MLKKRMSCLILKIHTVNIGPMKNKENQTFILIIFSIKNDPLSFLANSMMDIFSHTIKSGQAPLTMFHKMSTLFQRWQKCQFNDGCSPTPLFVTKNVVIGKSSIFSFTVRVNLYKKLFVSKTHPLELEKHSRMRFCLLLLPQLIQVGERISSVDQRVFLEGYSFSF